MGVTAFSNFGDPDVLDHSKDEYASQDDPLIT